MKRYLVAFVAFSVLAGCATNTTYVSTGDCKKPKMPKTGQDMTQYAEYLLKHIKRNCN